MRQKFHTRFHFQVQMSPQSIDTQFPSDYKTSIGTIQRLFINENAGMCPKSKSGVLEWIAWHWAMHKEFSDPYSRNIIKNQSLLVVDQLKLATEPWQRRCLEIAPHVRMEHPVCIYWGETHKRKRDAPELSTGWVLESSAMMTISDSSAHPMTSVEFASASYTYAVSSPEQSFKRTLLVEWSKSYVYIGFTLGGYDFHMHIGDQQEYIGFNDYTRQSNPISEVVVIHPGRYVHSILDHKTNTRFVTICQMRCSLRRPCPQFICRAGPMLRHLAQTLRCSNRYVTEGPIYHAVTKLLTPRHMESRISDKMRTETLAATYQKHLKTTPHVSDWKEKKLCNNLTSKLLLWREFVQIRRSMDPVKRLVDLAIESTKSRIALGLSRDPVKSCVDDCIRGLMRRTAIKKRRSL